jgi:ankyrin repeat protein
MIIYLLDKGADKNIRNRDGHLPIELTSVPAARELLEDTLASTVAMLT